MATAPTCLRVGVENTLVSLVPDFWTSLTDVQIGRHIYQGLLAYDHKMRLKPALAKSWEVSADGREWRFKLRPGIAFHNGEPLNAEVALWNLEHRIIWVSRLFALIEKIFINDAN